HYYASSSKTNGRTAQIFECSLAFRRPSSHKGELTDDADGNRERCRLYEGNSRVFWRLMAFLREAGVGYSKRHGYFELKQYRINAGADARGRSGGVGC